MGQKKNWTGERLEPGIFNETAIEHLHRYALAADLVKGLRVLDIACGEGYGANLLAETAATVTGADRDAAVIRRAAEKYKKPNLHFIQGNAEQIPADPRSFDTVVSFETLEHLDNHQKMMEECKRVLKENGLLIISTPNKKRYSDETGYQNPFHRKELYEEELLALLRQYFRNVQLLKQETLHGSLITGVIETPLQLYAGGFEKIIRPAGPNPLFFIALASDRELPQIGPSLFNGHSVFEKALQEKEKIVTGTLTYKTGHILLYPLKLLRKIFKK